MKFVLLYKGKETEICPPLLLKLPHTVFANFQSRETKKSANDSNFNHLHQILLNPNSKS